MAMLTAGCVRKTSEAALENPFSWTTLVKYSNWAISMPVIITTTHLHPSMNEIYNLLKKINFTKHPAQR
jgi:hypothetical protein